MGDILVDPSVWIAFFRRSARPPWRTLLAEMLDDDSAVVVDVTIAELLVGVRGDRERRVILDLAGSARRASLDLHTWIAAGDLARQWREKGRTLSLADCLLAVVARRDRLPLWTLDDDFEPLVVDGVLTRFKPKRA